MVMSSAIFSRIRRMEIRDLGTDKNFLVRLSVIDPVLHNKEIVYYNAREQIDVERVKRAWCTKYRIPLENVKFFSRRRTEEEIKSERVKLDKELQEIKDEIARKAAEMDAQEKAGVSPAGAVEKTADANVPPAPPVTVEPSAKPVEVTPVEVQPVK